MNSCVLVTGCSSGIGKATALYFQKQGWQVVATMRTPGEELDWQSQSNMLVLPLDITLYDSITNAIKEAIKNFQKIDVLVNNAGIGAYQLFEETPENELRKAFETNVFGTMLVTKAVLPYFRENRKGTIINVTSSIVQVGAPLITLYSATKKAIEGFSHALYYELLPFGIKVKLVQPGLVKTKIAMQHDYPPKPTNNDYLEIYAEVIKRYKHRYETASMAEPEEVAEMIFKAATSNSPQFRYISGHDAKLLSFMMRLLPEHTLKNFVCKNFGLKI